MALADVDIGDQEVIPLIPPRPAVVAGDIPADATGARHSKVRRNRARRRIMMTTVERVMKVGVCWPHAVTGASNHHLHGNRMGNL